MPQARDGATGEAGNDAALLTLFDLLGRRWGLRILWELRGEPMTFRELAASIPGISSSVLTQRLWDLRTARLVEHEHGAGYRLTALGTDLLTRLRPLRDWAERVGFTSSATVE